MEKMTTDKMQAIGLSWSGINDFVGHIANVLEDQGATFADVARTGLKLVSSVMGRDLMGVFAALQDGKADYAKIADDIRKEFGLNAPPAPAPDVPPAPTA